ncbi:UNVERIFIED_CONTAM: hypothetical protein Sradi_0867400 [Sesamum radiatum]|uniref:Uncharacterized protein n=1 Tax=Sesamum radiatum TaxID=300843 RepID=A0AAW2V6X1_SESRA
MNRWRYSSLPEPPLHLMWKPPKEKLNEPSCTHAPNGWEIGASPISFARGSPTMACKTKVPSERPIGRLVQIVEAPVDEQQGVPFTEIVMADEFPTNCSTSAIAEYDGTIDPQEHLSRSLRTQPSYTDVQMSSKAVKNGAQLFAVRDKENEHLKEYLQKFNATAMEVPSATQEMKASVFSEGLLDGDFFKSLAKKPVPKFDALLAHAAKYINMEDTQAIKKESRGVKRKEMKEDAPTKKPQTDFQDKKPPFERVNVVCSPLPVPITHGRRRKMSFSSS